MRTCEKSCDRYHISEKSCDKRCDIVPVMFGTLYGTNTLCMSSAFTTVEANCEYLVWTSKLYCIVVRATTYRARSFSSSATNCSMFLLYIGM